MLRHCWKRNRQRKINFMNTISRLPSSSAHWSQKVEKFIFSLRFIIPIMTSQIWSGNSGPEKNVSKTGDIIKSRTHLSVARFNLRWWRRPSLWWAMCACMRDVFDMMNNWIRQNCATKLTPFYYALFKFLFLHGVHPNWLGLWKDWVAVV